MNLLPIGSRAILEGYSVQNEFTERLRELGLVRGTMVTIVRKAPFGGPIEIRYGNSQLALRASELSWMNVKPA